MVPHERMIPVACRDFYSFVPRRCDWCQRRLWLRWTISLTLVEPCDGYIGISDISNHHVCTWCAERFAEHATSVDRRKPFPPPNVDVSTGVF